ncbi:phage/plasmid primase, P4 family [Paenibacillus sp. TAF58]
MTEKNKAASEEQPHKVSSTSIISQDNLQCLIQVAEVFGGEVAFIRLRGYSSSNKETDPYKKYSAAKMPIDKNWTGDDFDSPAIGALVQWIELGGWVGMRVPTDHIIVDVDNVDEGHAISQLLQHNNVRHHQLKTPNGYQFIFKDANLVNKQNVKMFTDGGFEVDYRLQQRGQVVLPTSNTEGREWIQIDHTDLDEMPYWFSPLFQVSDKNARPFHIPIGEGSRNNTLFQHACRLKKMARTEDQIFKSLEFIGTYLCVPSVDSNEISKTVQSAMKYKDDVIKVDRSPISSSPNDFVRSTEKHKFNNTDFGNAERLVYHFGDDLKYCHLFGTWYIWDGKRWCLDETGEIERKAKATVRKMYKEAIDEEDDHRRVALMKHATNSESKQRISNMISLAQSEEGIPVTPAQLDGDQWVLNCTNGTLDLKTGELVPHQREQFMTNLISVEYNPNADCPNWIKFLNRIMQDAQGNERPGLVEFLQRAVGYALTGSIKEQVIFFLYGSGKNGKSTFINTIKDLLGDYARQSSTETFMAKQSSGGATNDLARLKGARLVSAVESEEGKRLAESLIKQLTGGEPITARFLHKEFFEFTPTFKIFFVTNHKPQIRNSDLGIWRRIRLIPFNATIRVDEDDKSLPEKLRDEMPGILKWAVEGCLMWQKDGLVAPEEVMNATNEYRDEMDTMSHFVRDFCIVNPLAKASSADLYDAYKEWCEDNGEYTLTKNKFITKLRERMESHGNPITDYRTNTGRYWKGIALADKTDLPNISDTVTQGDTQKGVIKDFAIRKENTKNSVTSVTKNEIMAGSREVAAAVGMEEGEL